MGSQWDGPEVNIDRDETPNDHYTPPTQPTMAEPTVFVPVSLIQDAIGCMREDGRIYEAERLAPYLSQPTPTAEPDAASKLQAVSELARKARWGCERWADPLPVPQYVLDLEAIIDPPTIRDVTSPKGQ